MIQQLLVTVSDKLDAYYNLAYEQELIRICPCNAMILYIWTNDNCVVIGANQNAYSQVNLTELNAVNGKLTRRSSGGGAVYHDKNNLNFSFICNKSNYNLNLNFQIIVDALKKIGLNAVVSGRNDMTIDGCKFSGNAFLYTSDTYLHHGTILIDTDTNIMSRLLMPDQIKLAKHSVDSVKSRVINLKQLVDIDNKKLTRLIIDSASESLNLPANNIDNSLINNDNIKQTIKRISSKEYLFKKFTRLNKFIKCRLETSMIEVYYEIKDNCLSQAEVYTDSLDINISNSLEKQLLGIKIDEHTDNDDVNTILRLIKENI